MTKLSVITIAYNAEATIEKTLQSIAEQHDQDFEYIVQDSASEDATLAIVERYCDRVTTLTSEPDEGIADGMNRALKKATGDYVFMLHADDYFADSGVIARVRNVMARNPGKDIYAFDILKGDLQQAQRLRATGLSWHLNFKQQLWHQGIWTKRSLFKEIGDFDTTFRIAMDYDWALRALRSEASCHINHDVICHMGDYGVSSLSDWTSLRRRLDEERTVHFRHSTGVMWNSIYRIYWLIYKPYRYLRNRIRGR